MLTRRIAWLISAACIALLPRPAAARQAAQTSSFGAVYEAAQAARGETTFASICTSCHTTATHSGTAFMKNWAGYSLWDLYAYISTSMPKSDPGSLSPKEYGDLVAYILKLNGMPPGERPLPVDSTTLKTIRIDSVPPPHTPSTP